MLDRDKSKAQLLTELGALRERIAVLEAIDISPPQGSTALPERQHFGQAALDSLPTHIAVLDASGTIIAVNAAWRRFADANGLRWPNYCLGTNYLDVCDAATGSDAEHAQQVARGIRGVISRQRSVFLYEYSCHSADEQRWFRMSITRFVEEGSLYVVVAHENITPPKEAEQVLRQAQKMEDLGTLAGSIAHDFNNILAVIIGYTELATFDIPQHSVAWQNLQEVLTASKRARDLVQQILTFSRQNETERKPIVLATLVRETLRLLCASPPSSIEIHHDIPEDSGTVLADPTQLHQVIMNLYANAEHAMRATGGLLLIQVDTVDVDAPLTFQHTALHIGPYVRVTVRDTGHGMTPEVRERIFEPFFTTKAIGEGAGMGLAMAHGIVANHGGAITVDSTPGDGTTIALYLPRIEDTPARHDFAEGPMMHGIGRILFVDDEEVLILVERAILEWFGYEVDTSSSSLESLDMFRANPHHYDLVITDQTMPHMTGEKLVQELRRIRPDIPIVLCTDFSHLMDTNKAQALGIDAFCMKPMQARELAGTIQQVLRTRSAEGT